MKYKITAAEYAALSDEFKAHYGGVTGDGMHVLKVDGVDIAGMQARVDEFRTTNTTVMRERDQLTERLKAYEGLDAAAARAAIALVARRRPARASRRPKTRSPRPCGARSNRPSRPSSSRSRPSRPSSSKPRGG